MIKECRVITTGGNQLQSTAGAMEACGESYSIQVSDSDKAVWH